MKIGYHYCSTNTFLEILKNKSIFMSDPLKMNDSEEIVWSIQKMKSASKPDDEVDLSDDKTWTVQQLLEVYSGVGFTFDELLERLESKGQNSVFITCFSKEGDILSQWRAYADDGKGVAIGFDLNALAKGDNILIKDVQYKRDDENVALCSVDGMTTVLENENIKDIEKKKDILLHEVIPDLVCFKNPGFEEEKEVRLIYCSDMKFEKIIDEAGAFKEKCEWKKMDSEFRVQADGSITEYVKLDFDPSAIHEIVLGPKCPIKPHDVMNICDKLLKVKPIVKKSNTSYR